MSKISSFVLVSPGNFYTRKHTYTCTACGHEFRFDANKASEAIAALEREHICETEPLKTVTATFPLIRLLHQHQAQEAKKLK